MRLLLTVEVPDRGLTRDLICEYDAETTVADLARHLTRLVSGAATDIGVETNVVDLRTGLPRTAITPDLFLGAERLDPDEPLAGCGVRHGATLGLSAPSTHRGSEPGGAVEVRIVSGRGAGSITRLGIGTATIGSADHCTIRIDDPLVPAVAVTMDVALDGTVTISPDPAVEGAQIPQPHRREPATEPIVLAASTVRATRRRRWWRRRTGHTTLELGDRVDPLAPRPLVRLDRVSVGPQTVWQPGHELGVGHVLLTLSPVEAPDASLSPSATTPELEYNRPPRLHPAVGPREFALPSEPQRPDKMPIPFAMMIAPLLMSGAMYAMTRSPYTLMMAGMSPMMMLINATGSRRQQKRRWLNQLDDYHRKRASVETAALTALVDERQRRRSTLPDPASLLLLATGPRARLWERRRWDPDFLLLRVGTSDLPSEIVVKDPARAAHEGPLRWTAADVPVPLDLGGLGVVGLAGDPSHTRRLTSWLIAQTAILHSPTDVDLMIFGGADGRQAWDWAKWLPHVRGPEGGRPVRLSVDDDSTASLLGELSSIVGQRRELDSNDVAALNHVVVVLDGARELRMLPGMISALKDGPALGVHFLCLDRTAHELPEECRSVIDVEPDLLSVQTTQQRHIDGVQPDVVSDDWLDRLARAVAPIRDVSTEDLAATLPTASRLLDVIGMPRPDGDTIAQRWAAGGRTTRAVIGEGLEGPFSIDVRADGPHGLIAGTTGSGKSELLQTIIASLAVGNRADEFTFVLIDYKGGAAFMDCADLPHTVGMVTDLDGHLTTRALESLRAELHYRERQLAAARAKDIEDYLAGREPDDEPMPRLLIVIDEFAALVAELPDFVTGLVDVARRGRSLGVHLILATQRPAGVVSAEIKSNTNLRIALRVTDAGDSQDVIESVAAADIAKSTPGRAYARLGASSLLPFQSSRVGGRPAVAGAGSSVGFQPFEWDDLGRRRAVGAAVAGADDGVEVPTDLATLVGAIRDAHARTGLGSMRKPWLPPLPAIVGLDSCDLASVVEGVVPPIPLGLADLPASQQQKVETWDIERAGHLMISGQPRTGRSSALRTIAGGIARQCSPADVHLYGIDAGNNALLPLVGLPHVGAVVTRLQPDRMSRLITMLQREVARRQQDLAEHGFADIGEQRRGAAPEDRLPYLVVLLDRLEGFVQTFESVDGGILIERLHALLQEGAGVGLRFVIGADRSGVLGRISMLVEDRILLAMAEPSDYTTIGLSPRSVPKTMGPGRAFRGGEQPRELQFAMLEESGEGIEQVRVLHELAEASTARWSDLDRSRRPRRVDNLPTSITWEAAALLDREGQSPTFLPLGVGGDTLTLLGVDTLLSGPGLLVAGPPRTGRSTALLTIALDQIAAGREVMIIAPRQSPLRDVAGAHVVSGSEPADELKKLLSSRRPHTVLVDDFEVLGADSPAAAALIEAYGAMRDTANAMVVAGGVDELNGMYRGLPAEIKKGRTGLILAPRSSTDGDLFTARLPRSVGGPVPVGRAVLVTTTGWTWVQVPKPG